MVMHWFTQALLSESFIKYIPKENARGSLRSKEIAIPNIKDCGTNTFRYKGARLWNSLPAEIRFLPSLNHLKLLYINIALLLIPINSVYIRMSRHFVLQDKYLLFHLILKYFTYFYN